MNNILFLNSELTW